MVQFGHVAAVFDQGHDPIYLAAVEATDEAVVNAMLAAEDMTTLQSPRRVCRAIDHDALLEVMRRYNRCA